MMLVLLLVLDDDFSLELRRRRERRAWFQLRAKKQKWSIDFDHGKKNSRITDPDIVGWRSSIEITARSSSRSGSSFVIREVIQTGRIFGRHVPHRSEPPIEDITRSCEHTKFLLAIVWPGEGVGFFLLSHPPPTLRAPIGNTTSASCLSQNEQDEDEQSGGSMEWILGDSINTC